MPTSWSSKISKDLNWTLKKKPWLRKRTNTCAPVNHARRAERVLHAM